MILTSLEKQPSFLQNALIVVVPMSQDYGMSFRLLQPQYEKPKSRGRQKVNSLFLMSSCALTNLANMCLPFQNQSFADDLQTMCS